MSLHGRPVAGHAAAMGSGIELFLLLAVTFNVTLFLTEDTIIKGVIQIIFLIIL